MRGCLLVFLLFAGIHSDATAAPGFWPAQSSNIPAAVQRAEASILKILFPYYLTMKRDDARGFLSATHLTDEGRRDIQECLNSTLTHCSFPIFKIEGTAFRDRSSDSLWTNCHLIDGWLRYQKYQSLLNQDSYKERLRTEGIKTRLVDSAGRVLADDVEYYLEVFNVSDGEGPQLAGCNFSDDAVRIRGPQLDLPTLKWAKGIPGERSFIGGYPRKTDSREKIKKPDSSGESFYWTEGRVLSGSAFEEILLAENLPIDKYSLARVGAFSLMLSNDGAEGMSGGPILNAQGEVIGIFRGLLPSPATRFWPLATVGISNLGMRFIELMSGL